VQSPICRKRAIPRRIDAPIPAPTTIRTKIETSKRARTTICNDSNGSLSAPTAIRSKIDMLKLVISTICGHIDASLRLN